MKGSFQKSERLVAGEICGDSSFLIQSRLRDANEKEIHSSIWAKHETLNGSLRNLDVLLNSLCHTLEKYVLRFHAVGQLHAVMVKASHFLLN